MSVGLQACDIVLPGYTLSERIGSGGYAEVWRAEAPGGIEKAVKIVYGFYNDELASQELKSLERIKGVRHPFLLSLERFEVINGRLAILTELAEMSLDQRLSQCHASGLPGIPRDELVRYMSDAAEALDFLANRHSLLHLDIKPENLLISGDHIKVADFGLVKELATRTQNSLVTGMTPTYAAPEIFDDEPSAQSDQYSLAIVYQQMLVGTLPFPGRTAAQLAKQHTQSEPQLNSLPADDRPVVARALAKKPTDRFPTCRAFVDALLHRFDVSPPTVPAEAPRPRPVVPQPSAPDVDDTKPSSACATLRRNPNAQAEKGQATFTQAIKRDNASVAQPKSEQQAAIAFVAEESVDIAVPPVDQSLRREQPTLYIAAGGVGIQVLCRLRALTAQDESAEVEEAVEAIALDTDRDELREACSKRWKSPLTSSSTLHLPLRLSKDYDNSPNIDGWVSRRWLYNIPRSLETRGYRPLGRVALVDNLRHVREIIEKKLQRLSISASSPDAAGEARESEIKVVILSSTGGGTGAGIVIDLANAARSVAAAQGLEVEVHGFFVCTCFSNSNTAPLVAANTYSLLTELNHTMQAGNTSTNEKQTQTQIFDSSDAPFNSVSWVPAESRASSDNSADTLTTVARYLALEWAPDTRAALRSCRSSKTPREDARGRSLTLKMPSYASLADQKHKLILELAKDLAQTVKQHWLTIDNSADWDRLIREEQQRSSTPNPVPTTGSSNAPQNVVPDKATTTLELRGRFKDFARLEFTSEVLRQIERRLDSRDERGQPLYSARDGKLMADTARAAIASLAPSIGKAVAPSRFADSTACSMIAECSRRVLSKRIDHFDLKQPETFLPAAAVDELIRIESASLLEDSLAGPDLSNAMASVIDLDGATTRMAEQAQAEAMQCGSERRTLLFVPRGDAHHAAVEKLQSAMPLATAVAADVDDVLLVSEKSGISPQAVAHAIERTFPGVADAARRLFTRIDINWQNLL